MSAKPNFFPKCFPRCFTPQIILLILFSDFFVHTLVLIDCDLGGVCPHRYPSLFREAAARGIEISHWVIGEKGGREEDVRLADLHTSPLPPPPQMVQWVSPELLSSSLAEYRDMPETDESGEV